VLTVKTDTIIHLTDICIIITTEHKQQIAWSQKLVYQNHKMWQCHPNNKSTHTEATN